MINIIKIYTSDINREAFQEIEPLLLSNRKRPRPRTVDVYEVFCALLYILKSGCQWGMLPRDFPSKSTVYYYFKLWKEKPSEMEPSLLEQALKKCSWRGPHQPWSERQHYFHDS
ncbi:transposase [Xenorhabdus sp. GDc328]|nr:transposase [Xenorhabdus griffiniae]KOP32852.1 transposase [Xenorhabdus sp. GDc328]